MTKLQANKDTRTELPKEVSTPTGEDPLRIGTTDLFAKIGSLTVENELLRAQLARALALIGQMNQKTDLADKEKVKEEEVGT